MQLLLPAGRSRSDGPKQRVLISCLPGQAVPTVGLCTTSHSTRVFPKHLRHSPAHDAAWEGIATCPPLGIEPPFGLCLPPDLIPVRITEGLSSASISSRRSPSRGPRALTFGTPACVLFPSPSQTVGFSLPGGCLESPVSFPQWGGLASAPLDPGLPRPPWVSVGTCPLKDLIWGFGV